MKKNVGGIDTILRYISGAILILLGIFLSMGTAFKAIFLIFGIMLIGTGLFGFCWLYTILGVSTKREKKA